MIVALPVVCTNLVPPTAPLFIVIDEPISVVPVPFGPPNRVKSLIFSCWPFAWFPIKVLPKSMQSGIRKFIPINFLKYRFDFINQLV